MLALVNVNTTMLTTASNAHKHVAAVQKNVEEWLDNNSRAILIFFDFLRVITTTLLELQPPPPLPFRQTY
jgi:hypothetical protein